MATSNVLKSASIARPDKNRPSPEWIASLRARYAIEPQIDQLLTRKMQKRAGPGFTPIPLPKLAAAVEALVKSHLGTQSFKLSDARWLAGGASKLQMAFTLEWDRPGVGHEKTPMVLRMEPAESIVATSRLREFQLIRAFGGVIPVPPIFWCDEEAKFLPYPGLIYAFAEGVTKATGAKSGVSGSGTYVPPELRPKLIPQFIDHLAIIHNLDFRKANLTAFEVPQPGTQCAEWGINWWDRIWEEDAEEDVPMMHVASAWLRRNMPTLDKPSIVHSDYRVGNFLFTEHDSKITAWLDWELGRVGDRHQDLAWTTSRAFAGMHEDEKTVLVCGLMPEPKFFDAYEKASGVTLNPKTMHWYKVYNSYSLAIILMQTGYRIARNGKTHQDVLVTWLIGISYMILDEIRDLIEKGR
jgi:aminoglycoside phosphotransferase (APT) family kinase protein